MPNPFPFPLGAARHNNAVAAINSLVYAHLWAGAGTQVTVGNVRIDVQGTTGAGQNNLQIQINGVPSPSTIATVLINPTAVALLPPANAVRVAAQETEILRRSKSAFFDSLNDFEQNNPHIWRVTGNPSS